MSLKSIICCLVTNSWILRLYSMRAVCQYNRAFFPWGSSSSTSEPSAEPKYEIDPKAGNSSVSEICFELFYN